MIFVDGVLKDSNIKSGAMSDQNGVPVYFGGHQYVTVEHPNIGHIDEARVTIGVARYAGDFTPQNAPFDSAGVQENSNAINGLIVSSVSDQSAGKSRILGTVRLENAPAPDRRVLLYDPKSMRPIAQTFADAAGGYEFSGIKAGTYLVVGQDRRTQYHPDIVRVNAEPMP